MPLLQIDIGTEAPLWLVVLLFITREAIGYIAKKINKDEDIKQDNLAGLKADLATCNKEVDLLRSEVFIEKEKNRLLKELLLEKEARIEALIMINDLAVTAFEGTASMATVKAAREKLTILKKDK